MLAQSPAPEFSLHIQVTVSHSLLRCKQADKNQDYSAAHQWQKIGEIFLLRRILYFEQH